MPEAGTVWAGRKLGHNVPERVAGCDLFVELAKLSAKKGYKVFFFGAAPGIAEAARDKLLLVAPGLKVAGCRNGYFTEAENEEIIAEINASGADMLFAALMSTCTMSLPVCLAHCMTDSVFPVPGAP